MNLFKRYFSWTYRPWLLSLMAIGVLSLLIWFEGPLLAFDGKEPFASENVRWIVIGAMLLLWLGYFIWKYLVALLSNRQLMDALAAKAPPSAPVAPAPEALLPGHREAATEIATLTQRMQDAIATLRSTRQPGFRGWQYLYHLPWYLFIGAPGSGKTTALLHSGLRFPLSEKLGKTAVGGVGGTRNCDWWFTDEAVMLDTAGRYTTQDSHEAADKAAWFGFLDLLRKYRKRRPINGVIVALSISDLLNQNHAARQAQALAIRARINELHERLGVRFPVYVVITKCDLLPGFFEFFENFGRDERAQVWGMTFPLVEAGQVARSLSAFPEEFKALEERLHARLLPRMQQERDLRRRALVYGFPQQFSTLEPVLNDLLQDVFQTTRYEEAALLRGVYFTSGTQEGSPIDRLIGALTAAFNLKPQGLPPNVATGRSYFVTRLLREVMFQEAGIAGTNLRREKRRKILQWIAMAVIAGVLTGWSIALLTSYYRNQHYNEEIATRTALIAKMSRTIPPEGSPVEVLPFLNAIRTLPGGYAEERSGVPLLNRLGLYQGDKLGSGARTLYARQLHDVLLPRVVAYMESELRRGNANSPEYLYELLRVYLILGDPRHFDAETTAAWLDVEWIHKLPDASESQRQELMAHVVALLATLESADMPARLDAALIEQSRLSLASLPLSQRIYNRVRREISRAHLTEFSVSNAIGQDASQIFVRRSGEPLTRGIPGLFTVAGYSRFREALDQAIVEVKRDSWVLAQQESTLASGTPIKNLVEQIYFEEYIKQWDLLLADVSILPLTSLDQSARITNALGAVDSPLRKFLREASRDTTLQGTASRTVVADSVSTVVKYRVDEAKRRLQSALMPNAERPATIDAGKGLNPVDVHFASLHLLTGAPGASGPVPIDQLLALFRDAAVYFDGADSAQRRGLPAPSPEPLARLKREADSHAAPLNSILKNVGGGGAHLAQGSEHVRLNALWRATGAKFCAQAIAGRYPLTRGATQNVTPDDFGKYFGPGGLSDDFFQKNLAVYADMSGAQWRWRNAGPDSLGFSQEALSSFQHAARIRDMFFSAGGQQPSMRFYLKPLSADDALGKVILDIDGQQVIHVPGGTPAASQIQLPSGKGSGQVRFEIDSIVSQSGFRTEGPWAWLRMIDKGRLEPVGQGEHFKLYMTLNGHSIIYDLNANSVLNPFRLQSMEPFRCPDHL